MFQISIETDAGAYRWVVIRRTTGRLCARIATGAPSADITEAVLACRLVDAAGEITFDPSVLPFVPADQLPALLTEIQETNFADR